MCLVPYSRPIRIRSRIALPTTRVFSSSHSTGERSDRLRARSRTFDLDLHD